MDTRRFEKAQTLARRDYQALVFPDRTTDGDSIYVAVVLEIPGCNSFGYSVQEAMENLESAKADFIYFLLEDGLPVPEPQLLGQRVRINMSDYTGFTAAAKQESPGPNAVFLQSLPDAG